MEKTIDLGKPNQLQVRRKVDFGFYLGIDQSEDILLPKRYAPKDLQINDLIDVFVYLDSEDRIIATTEKAYAQVGDFAYLKALSLSPVGAFLDWGLSKDLLLPFREQREPVEEGKSYLVHLFVDEKSNRIVASSKLSKFLRRESEYYSVSDEVDIIFWRKSDLGFQVIVDNHYLGLIHQADIFQEINVADQAKAYIKKIRDDGKIDICLQKIGYQKVGDFSDSLYEQLQSNNGFLSIHDKSSPEVIYQNFSVSKATFKKAIGNLYKRRLITIEKDGIYLNKTEEL